MDILPGWKSAIACAGLIGLSIYNFSQGDFSQAVQNVLAALAIYGIHAAVVRNN